MKTFRYSGNHIPWCVSSIALPAKHKWQPTNGWMIRSAVISRQLVGLMWSST